MTAGGRRNSAGMSRPRHQGREVGHVRVMPGGDARAHLFVGTAFVAELTYSLVDDPKAFLGHHDLGARRADAFDRERVSEPGRGLSGPAAEPERARVGRSIDHRDAQRGRLGDDHACRDPRLPGLLRPEQHQHRVAGVALEHTRRPPLPAVEHLIELGRITVSRRKPRAVRAASPARQRGRRASRPAPRECCMPRTTSAGTR